MKKTRKEFRSENRALRAEMKKEFAQVNKKLDKTADFLDWDYLKLLKRIERIEKHLKLTPPSPLS